jgi:nitric oxide dioxygenase
MTMDNTTPISERIVQGTPDAVIYADRDGAVQLWNAGAEAMFGWTATEAIGQPLDMIIPERLRARHWEGWHRVIATGETRYGRGELLAVPGQRKDGSRLSLEFSIALLHDHAGRPAGVAAILRDVSERWEEDRALRKRLAELEAAAKPATPATDA